MRGSEATERGEGLGGGVTPPRVGRFSILRSKSSDLVHAVMRYADT